MPETFTWIDPDGNSTTLTALYGLSGRFQPPISLVQDDVPQQAGGALRTVNVDVRDVDVPILIEEASESELRSSIRALLHQFNPARGDGRLRVTAPGGDVRELFCRYLAGMGLEETQQTNGQTWQKAVLVFRAFDPYWYSTTTQSQTFTTGQQATFFPFFPLTLVSSTVFADATATNDGDVEAWPQWIVTGPGSSIVLRNLTTGKSLTLSVTLAAGETVTIDTRPGKKTVEKNDGSNLYGSLSSDSSLWQLQKGDNAVRIEMSSSTADSEVQLQFNTRFLGV